MDEALRKLSDRFAKEMEEVDEVVNVLLKGHLLIEEALTRIIELYVFHRKYLDDAKLNFAQKLQVARSLGLRKNEFGEWELIKAINVLRNEVAHNLRSPEREKKLDKVKEVFYREAAGHPKLAELKTESNQTILLAACAHCAGFLSALEDDSRALRHIIYTLDRARNPDLPAFEL